MVYGSKHFVQSVTAAAGAKKQKHPITGIYRRTSGGFGFVSPRPLVKSADRSKDIYIPVDKSRDAADGDLVAVRVKKGDGAEGGRLRGEVVEVLERETHRFVGTYSEDDGTGWVRVDGRLFAQPIAVGDPGAKNAAPGDKVVIEMVRFPSHTHDGEAVIVEVLGGSGQPGVDTLSIMREFDLPDAFPEDVLESARDVAELFEERIPEGRSDFTALTTVTIDPVDARDFDDAVSLEILENGHWKLGVHIADVSYFVPTGSPLDREARHRATSVYLPDRVIPMLPETISNHLASLQPERMRFTKSVFIEFTDEGVFVASDVYNGVIRSARRFAYEEVDNYLADREAWRSQLAAPVFELLGRMHQLAMILRRRRLDRGAIELTLPGGQDRLEQAGRGEGRSPGREHGEPSDHRRVHAGR